MVKLTIDHKPVEVNDGTTIMEAAASLGIAIPTMCYRSGYPNHPSCMVCMVKDADRGQLIPSCSMTATEGMNILTATDEVREVRREALELLLSDHVGDCEAPCRLSCPAFMDIPLMNRLIAAGDFEQALRIVRNEIALPLILGYICPAPCEKACKRKPMDQAVSICHLKRSTAQYTERYDNGLPAMAERNGKRVAIIGTGPAGLSAAFYLQKSGYSCTLFDQHENAGGAMFYDIPADRLPKDILEAEITVIRSMGAEFRMGIEITQELFQSAIAGHFDVVVLATGTMKPGHAGIFGLQPDEHGQFVDRKTMTTTVPGIFACGNIIREQKMAVHAAAQGKMAAQSVALFLGSKIPADARPGFNSVVGHLFEPEWQEYLQEGIPDQRVEPAGGFPAGLNRDEAMHEASRCMHCDCRKPASCKLRLYAGEYGANRKRFAGPHRKRLTRSLQHELVVYESEKCIRCGLCVEITQKHGESIGLSYAGRGFDVRIAVPFGGTTAGALTTAAGECVAACPTGALAWKNCEERQSP